MENRENTDPLQTITPKRKINQPSLVRRTLGDRFQLRSTTKSKYEDFPKCNTTQNNRKQRKVKKPKAQLVSLLSYDKYDESKRKPIKQTEKINPVDYNEKSWIPFIGKFDSLCRVNDILGDEKSLQKKSDATVDYELSPVEWQLVHTVFEDYAANLEVDTDALFEKFFDPLEPNVPTEIDIKCPFAAMTSLSPKKETNEYPEFTSDYFDAILTRNWGYLERIYNSNPIYQFILMDKETDDETNIFCEDWQLELEPFRIPSEGRDRVNLAVKEMARRLREQEITFEDTPSHTKD